MFVKDFINYTEEKLQVPKQPFQKFQDSFRIMLFCLISDNRPENLFFFCNLISQRKKSLIVVIRLLIFYSNAVFGNMSGQSMGQSSKVPTYVIRVFQSSMIFYFISNDLFFNSLNITIPDPHKIYGCLLQKKKDFANFFNTKPTTKTAW